MNSKIQSIIRLKPADSTSLIPSLPTLTATAQSLHSSSLSCTTGVISLVGLSTLICHGMTGIMSQKCKWVCVNYPVQNSLMPHQCFRIKSKILNITSKELSKPLCPESLMVHRPFCLPLLFKCLHTSAHIASST